MTDIQKLVEVLRRGAKLHRPPGFPHTEMTEWKAADALERLQAELEKTCCTHRTKLLATLEWLQDNEPSVFNRGLREAIQSCEKD